MNEVQLKIMIDTLPHASILSYEEHEIQLTLKDQEIFPLG